MQFHTLQSLQLWARIALPAKPSIYYLIQEVTTSSTFAVSWASSSTKRTDDWTLIVSNINCIEHRSHRTSIALNIDRIEHWLNRTRPYEPDRTNQTSFKYQTDRTSNIENRTSKTEHRKLNIENRTSKIEHRKLNIENWISNIDQTKHTNPPDFLQLVTTDDSHSTTSL